jgi:hypothetical protein
VLTNKLRDVAVHFSPQAVEVERRQEAHRGR